MKQRFSVFILYPFFWYLLFVAARLVFLAVYFNKSLQLPVSELLKTFVYGFRLDVAIVAYIVVLPSLVLTISCWLKGKFVKYFYHFYTAIALFVVTTVISGDLFMYRLWGFRLDATPLFYMSNLKAVTASVSIGTIIAISVAVVIFTAGFFYLYYKIIGIKLIGLQKSPKSVLLLLPLSLMLFIVMRGGIGIASLTTGSAYFSKNQFANHSAINPVWNVGFSITESNDLQRKYEYYSEKEMDGILSPLTEPKDSVLFVLNNSRPNIILIITESLTAKALEATGGKPGIMPQLSRLIKEGILFDQIYAASDRTDKGIAGVLAGYPSLPGTSPLKYQKLTEKLAFIPKKLNATGYKSEFFYGGTLEFANYRSFLVQAGFDKMISDKDLPASELKTKWGAFDHVVFNRCLDETPVTNPLFFKTILTLTSHEPFVTPVPPVFKGDDDDTKFLNSLHYTDSAIGEFIEKAKTKSWWKNTLVIIVADHGSIRPGSSELTDKSKYHIPVIWLGGALRVTDTVVHNIGSQTDIAATLLTQLGMDASDFKFSKNILTTNYIPYAFFTFNNGFGFINTDNFLIYNTITNTYTDNLSIGDSVIKKQAKAYLQSIFLDSFRKNK